MLKAQVEDNPYTPVFNMWVSSLSSKWASRVNENNRAIAGSITDRDAYASMWREMNEEGLFPARLETLEIDTTDERQTHNLWELVRILEGLSPRKISIGGRGGGEYTAQDVADGIKRKLSGGDRVKETPKTLFKKMKEQERFLEEFILAIKPPPNFNPDDAEEDEMPYRMGDSNVGTLMVTLTKKDMSDYEKIYEARGGTPKSEQSFADIDFDSMGTDPKIRDSWTKLRVMLGNPEVPIVNRRNEPQQVQPVQYYTLQFEEKEEPLFLILKYIFNKFGTGKSGKRFYDKATQDRLRTAIEEQKTKRKPRSKLKKPRSDEADEQTERVRERLARQIREWREEQGLPEKEEEEEEEEIDQVSGKDKQLVDKIAETERRVKAQGFDTRIEIGGGGFELWVKHDGKWKTYEDFLKRGREE